MYRVRVLFLMYWINMGQRIVSLSPILCGIILLFSIEFHSGYILFSEHLFQIITMLDYFVQSSSFYRSSLLHSLEYSDLSNTTIINFLNIHSTLSLQFAFSFIMIFIFYVDCRYHKILEHEN